MASQDEMHERTRASENTESDRSDEPRGSKSVELETTERLAAPFSEFDPFRSSRIDTLHGETKSFLDTMGKQLSGFETTDEDELRSLQRDAEERQKWSQARQDAFRSILRLGATIPSRGKRVL